MVHKQVIIHREDLTNIINDILSTRREDNQLHNNNNDDSYDIGYEDGYDEGMFVERMYVEQLQQTFSRNTLTDGVIIPTLICIGVFFAATELFYITQSFLHKTTKTYNE